MEKPYPRRCCECKQVTVQATTIAKDVKIKHYKFHISQLPVDQCKNCGEVFFTNKTSDATTQALQIARKSIDLRPAHMPILYKNNNLVVSKGHNLVWFDKTDHNRVLFDKAGHTISVSREDWFAMQGAVTEYLTPQTTLQEKYDALCQRANWWDVAHVDKEKAIEMVHGKCLVEHYLRTGQR